MLECADDGYLLAVAKGQFTDFFVHIQFQTLTEISRFCAAIPAVSFAAVSAFRAVYSAKRPYEVLDIQPLIKKETEGKSFPSRHVFSVFIIGMSFFYIAEPMGIAAFVSGTALAYLRVVGGVHFPKDVAAGALFGILCGLPYFFL